MLESGEISLAVLWPGGASVFVRVHPMEQVKAVLDIVYRDRDCQFYPFVLHEGRLLELGLSLAFQGVTNNDVIVVYEHAGMWRREAPARESFEAKVYSVMSEALAVSDRIYRNFEGSAWAPLIYQTLRAAQPVRRSVEDPCKLVVPEKSEAVSTEPLPVLVEEEGEEEDDECGLPAFDNIEEVGKFFAKYPFSAWSW